MTSQLNVDTIVDKAGSGGTNVKIANNSVTVSEGGSGTQNTVQGLVKAWLHFNGSGTISITDSFNHASLTDHGTGDYSSVFTNNMNNANHATTGSTIKGAGGPSSSNVGLVTIGEGILQV